MFLSGVSEAKSQFAINLYEKTWPRANTACNFKKKRIELIIRGGTKFTESREKGYGEYVFYRYDKKVEVLPFSQSHANLYRFYKPSPDSNCAKTLGFPLEGDKFAVLIGEENKPYGDKLVIQIFDFKTMTPLETVQTNLLVEKAYSRPGGFIFKSYSERDDMDMGKVRFGDDNYTYQDRLFPIWMRYTVKGIEVDPAATYDKLPWKKYFKDKEDFLKLSGWDADAKKFLKPTTYFAVSHEKKKKCVLFLPKKTPGLTSKEDWHCR